jgi:hypothetical protein
LVEHVELPEFSSTRAEEWEHGKSSCLPDVPCERVKLGELFADRRIGRNLEPGLTHEQDAFGLDGQFNVKAEIAQHVDNDISGKLALKRFKISTHRRLRKVARHHHLQQLLVLITSGRMRRISNVAAIEWKKKWL